MFALVAECSVNLKDGGPTGGPLTAVGSHMKRREPAAMGGPVTDRCIAASAAPRPGNGRKQCSTVGRDGDPSEARCILSATATCWLCAAARPFEQQKVAGDLAALVS